MIQPSDFLAILAEAVGLKRIALDQNGRACIQLNDNIVIDLFDMEKGCFELLSPLDRFDDIGTNTMRSMLEFNYLGSGSGAGRLAINPFERGVVLCQRFNLAEGTILVLKESIDDFLKRVFYWHSDIAVSRYGGSAEDDKLLRPAETDIVFRL